MMSPTSSSFFRLVKGLQSKGKTCTVVESCSGGLLNAGIMSVAGASSVYFGGSVAYNTKKGQKLLLNDPDLHKNLTTPLAPLPGESEEDAYIRSKISWTEKTAVSFCEQMGVDFAIAEGGASGPTFRPKGMSTGFTVLAIAGREASSGKVRLLSQKTVLSDHNDRVKNMHFFAESAASFAVDTLKFSVDENENKSSTANVTHDSWFDRATKLRTDDEAIAQLSRRGDAKHVVIRNSSECLFSSESELALGQNIPEDVSKTFLGLDVSGTPYFSLDVDDHDDMVASSIEKGACFENIRNHGPLLTPQHCELAFHAVALSRCNRTHRFCTSCGEPMRQIEAGNSLQCTACELQSWPRQDPSMIVVVTSRTGDKVLLARSPRHSQKMYTALAGFVEAGETFEKAVSREVFEETGVRVDEESITYLSSQPWPFPHSCMVGFLATADDQQALNIDTDELSDARWFSKSTVELAAKVEGPVMDIAFADQKMQENPSLDLLIPPKGVIARALVEKWLQG